MKPFKFILLITLFTFFSYFAKAVSTIYEVEIGTLTGVNTSTATAGYTGTGYVTGFDAVGDNLVINVSVATAGIYKLYIRYRSPLGNKTQDIYINGLFSSSVVFASTSPFLTIQAGTVSLNTGTNAVSIKNSWGYVDIDNIGIEVNPPNVYNITPNLINPDATVKTKALYNLLKGQFTHCIFSGQTDSYWNSLVALSGKSPAVRGFEMQNYSPHNPWGWVGCCNAFAPFDDGNVQNAIDWYNATGGIVTFHWHWLSPSGGALSTSTFYTANTGFDVSRAVVTTNQEYSDVLRDIDAIAIQLKRLQTAGVPVLWRPLHEAGGAWFWWGAKGPAACLALYDIMYDRLTNFHGLNNLIWVWSTPEPTWYPGNSKVDIIGFDSYPGAFNYTTQKSVFDQLYTIVGGQKLIALSENGPIPDIAFSFSQDAPWSYFMSWNNLVADENSTPHIVASYNLSCNLSDLATLPVSFLSFEAEKSATAVVLKWQTASEINNDHFEIEKSNDGTHFQFSGKVAGALHSTKIESYTYFDNEVFNGRIYYRLKQVDVNGDYSYSTTVTVNNELPTLFSLFPNPGNGNYILKSLVQQKSNVEFKLYSCTGNLILSETKVFDSTIEEVEIDLQILPPGIYLVELIFGASRTTMKLVNK